MYRSMYGVTSDTRRALSKIVKMTLATIVIESQLRLNETCVITL